MEVKARDHGHSTPQMAGKFAAAAQAKHLVLTHFSARYKGDSEPDSVAIMDTIAAQVMSFVVEVSVLGVSPSDCWSGVGHWMV